MRAAAAVVTVLAAYGAGALTVAVSSPTPHNSRGDSVIDQAEHTIAAHAANPVPRSVLQQAAVQGMLKALDDHWSAYYGSGDFAHLQQVLSGAYTGVGVWVRRTNAGRMQVTNVTPGSPAAAAGLQRGDTLQAVGGRPITGDSVAVVVAALRGDPGSQVAVEVRRGTATWSTVLRRSTVDDDDVQASVLAPGIERLRVTAFTRGVGRWVRGQVMQAVAHHKRGLVLDLRDDPGGLLDEAVETASAFLGQGTVVSYVQRGRAPQRLTALGGGDTSTPLVVLVNGGTASAAEIVAAALQDRGRAVIVGSQTFGKSSVQEPSRLSDGSALELTVGHYLTPDGRSLDGAGITPDVLVPTGSGTTVVDQRVQEVLSGLTADTGSTGRG